jgi:hypothetical protein
MKAFDEKGRRWFARTEVEMVLGWAREPAFQALLREPWDAGEQGFFGTEEQVLDQIQRSRRRTTAVLASFGRRRSREHVLLTGEQHDRPGSFASVFHCGEPGCSVCDESVHPESSP